MAGFSTMAAPETKAGLEDSFNLSERSRCRFAADLAAVNE
jgi:hypothetical protein